MILTQEEALKDIQNNLMLEGQNILESKMNFELNEFEYLQAVNQDQQEEFFNEYKMKNNLHTDIVELNFYDHLFSIFEQLSSIQTTKWQSFILENIRLQNYYDANKLLVDCLNLASPEMRSHIEDTLLLPIQELEKRPFKHQE
ncbi:hypothetical protein FJR04_15780 [Anabaena sp. UHCC 0204]|nr:hypothetical protein [Anabaena sp. UHCC 0204]